MRVLILALSLVPVLSRANQIDELYIETLKQGRTICRNHCSDTHDPGKYTEPLAVLVSLQSLRDCLDVCEQDYRSKGFSYLERRSQHGQTDDTKNKPKAKRRPNRKSTRLNSSHSSVSRMPSSA